MVNPTNTTAKVTKYTLIAPIPPPPHFHSLTATVQQWMKQKTLIPFRVVTFPTFLHWATYKPVKNC
jgi:hypothetical protein